MRRDKERGKGNNGNGKKDREKGNVDKGNGNPEEKGKKTD